MIEVWTPTLGAVAGENLRQYESMLQQLVESAAWTVKEDSFFASEEDAKAQIQAMLEVVRRLVE